MKTRAKKRTLVQALITLVMVMFLSGCQVDLFTGLSEKQGNEMLSILLTHNIPAGKTAAKDNKINLQVDKADVANAIAILKANGYPKDEFADMGSIFEKQGLISSPLEERARYIFGLSQSVSETLSLIDGVITARVHIVLPEAQPLQEVSEPSSASVFIKHREGYDLEQAIPKIKRIVENSVEGLSYDKISVALFPVKNVELKAGPPLKHVLGMQVSADSYDELLAIISGLGGVIIAVTGSLAYFVMRKPKPAPVTDVK